MNNTFSLNTPFSICRGFSLNLRINWKVLIITELILVVSLLIFYIFQINNLTQSTYQIQQYQKKIDRLSQENESLRINSLKNNSLSTIETLTKDFGFEKVNNVQYIQILESQVVKK